MQSGFSTIKELAKKLMKECAVFREKVGRLTYPLKHITILSNPENIQVHVKENIVLAPFRVKIVYSEYKDEPSMWIDSKGHLRVRIVNSIRDVEDLNRLIEAISKIAPLLSSKENIERYSRRLERAREILSVIEGNFERIGVAKMVEEM